MRNYKILEATPLNDYYIKYPEEILKQLYQINFYGNCNFSEYE